MDIGKLYDAELADGRLVLTLLDIDNRHISVRYERAYNDPMLWDALTDHETMSDVDSAMLAGMLYESGLDRLTRRDSYAINRYGVVREKKRGRIRAVNFEYTGPIEPFSTDDE